MNGGRRGIESLGEGSIWSDSYDGIRLLAGRCSDCGTLIFPAPPICHRCLCEEIETESLPSEGVLYSFTEMHVGPVEVDKPFGLGYIDLTEGIRVFARLAAPAAGWRIDAPMRLVPHVYGGDATGASLSTYAFAPVESA